VYHLYVVRVKDRAGLQHHLGAAKIGTGIHYPIPLHLQKAYARLRYTEGTLPVAERAALEILSLPMYPDLRCELQREVAQEMERFVATQAPHPQKMVATAAAK
jgi:dTDP-4-amino-4,6-dideoxygalactose transaminase